MANMLKIGAIVAIGIILVLVIAWLIKGIISSPGTARIDNGGRGATAPAQLDSFTLIAKDSVRVTVRRVSDNSIVFDSPLTRDEERTVSIEGPVRVIYTNGHNLDIRYKGTRYKMQMEGPGVTTFPPP